MEFRNPRGKYIMSWSSNRMTSHLIFTRFVINVMLLVVGIVFQWQKNMSTLWCENQLLRLASDKLTGKKINHTIDRQVTMAIVDIHNFLSKQINIFSSQSYWISSEYLIVNCRAPWLFSEGSPGKSHERWGENPPTFVVKEQRV